MTLPDQSSSARGGLAMLPETLSSEGGFLLVLEHFFALYSDFDLMLWFDVLCSLYFVDAVWSAPVYQFLRHKAYKKTATPNLLARCPGACSALWRRLFANGFFARYDMNIAIQFVCLS